MMINTSMLKQHTNQYISIQGRLVGLEPRIGKNSHRFIRLKIVDGFGEAWAYAWEDSALYSHVETIDVGEQHLIELHGKIQLLNSRYFMRLSDVYVVSPSHIYNGAAMLPLPLVPVRARAAMGWLMDFIDTLSNEPLRTFLTGILLDPELGARFIRSRASGNYHSAYPGGLLVHSVEVAKLAGEWARMSGHSELSIAVTQVGALLHDLGKIDTVGEANPRPMNPGLFKHEHQTIHLLAPHINSLKAVAKIEGLVMIHLLSRLASPANIRCPLQEEELIRFADQASAGRAQKQKLEQFIRRLPEQLPSNDEAFDDAVKATLP